MEPKLTIAIDHGFGNIKTPRHVFRSGVTKLDSPPTYGQGILEYDGDYYLIGDTRKEFVTEKVWDDDYYILTLAAIAMELKSRGLRNAAVTLATGLPIKWIRKQREQFKSYLMKNEQLSFTFNHISYGINIAGVEVYPQGFSAVAEQLSSFQGVNILADIGNGTMNVLFIIDGIPSETKSDTEKFGVSQCILEMKNELMNQLGAEVDDSIIETVIKNGTADIGEKYLAAISASASAYGAKIMRKLREYGYHEDLTKLHFSGGGAVLMKHFGNLDTSKVNMIEDICATAKRYEYMSNQMKFKRIHAGLDR